VSASVVILCPKCGSNRIIPLNFVTANGASWHVKQMRLSMPPLAKCVTCGSRIYAWVEVQPHLPP
jgi:uncharacterized OB-fold protein